MPAGAKVDAVRRLVHAASVLHSLLMLLMLLLLLIVLLMLLLMMERRLQRHTLRLPHCWSLLRHLILCITSHVTSHTSRVTRHTSHVTHHTLQVTHHTPHLIPDVHGISPRRWPPHRELLLRRLQKQKQSILSVQKW